MKTHKGTIKRIKITSSGKILRRKKVRGSKIKARPASKRATRKLVEVSKADRRVIRRLIPGIKVR